MELFKTDLATAEIDALQTDQDRKAEQRKLQRQIDLRKKEMDKQNRKKDRIANRTANAKEMVFETPDARRFMIMNSSTLEKVDGPSENVLAFITA